MIVYLTGGINGLSDADAKDWREYAKEHLLHDTLDPMRRDYRGREDESVEDIVHSDLKDIDNSDAILASCVRPSWGTAMEIHYAANTLKRIFAVVPEGPISPWLRYHADEVVRSLDEAIDIMNGLA